MKETDLQLIQNVLRREIDYVSEAVTQFVGEGAKATTGVWKNEANKLMAYFSYYPNSDPKENSIDATIEVDINAEKARFQSSICWSNGVVITEIIDTNFTFSSEEQFLQQLYELSQSASKEMISYLGFILK